MSVTPVTCRYDAVFQSDDLKMSFLYYPIWFGENCSRLVKMKPLKKLQMCGHHLKKVFIDLSRLQNKKNHDWSVFQLLLFIC